MSFILFLKDLPFLLLSATAESSVLPCHLSAQRFPVSNNYGINEGKIFFQRIGILNDCFVVIIFQRIILYFNKGDHGFDNVYMDMKTIFRAFGPDFKKNHLAEPFDSIHIYPLMCKLLGVTPEPHNGSLAVTQEMLVDTYDQHTGKTQKPPPRDW